MRKPDFDHVVAAAVDVSGEREIVVIGSQAILASVDDPPAALVESMELDVYPLNDPDKAEEIDAVLGDGPLFRGPTGSMRTELDRRPSRRPPAGRSG